MKATNQEIFNPMKASELRLGNLVTIDKIVCTIEGIYSNEAIDVSFKTSKGIETKKINPLYGIYEPIPLTKEWLSKLGCKQTEINFYWLPLYNLKAELHFEIYTNEIVTTIVSDFCKLILDRIKYVHELQNLFFALTNEELTFKE